MNELNFILTIYNQLARDQRYAIYLGKPEYKTNKAITQYINIHLCIVNKQDAIDKISVYFVPL